MAKKKKKETEITDKKTVLDHLNTIVDSPLRLFAFSVALLVISLTTGMLIGSAVKDGKSALSAGPIHPSRPDLTLNTQEQGEKEETGEKEPEGEIRKDRPADALAFDNPYSISRTNGADIVDPDHSVENNETEVASLPPKPEEEVRDKENQPAWKRFAALVEPAKGRPRIAMVIDDVGINKRRVNALVNLPQILTLAFLPYASGLKKSVTLTRSKGHEVMLHLPMEPLHTTADPGPDALLKSLSLEEIRTKTLKNLGQFSGYVGVNNHMGSKFTSYEDGMAAVMDILHEKGLLFLDSRTTPTSTGYKLAKDRGMPTATRDVFIDNEINEQAILKQLKTVERIASKNGIAIAIGHPHKETIAALNQWMPEAVKRGFHFVPISAILLTKEKS